MTWRIVPPLELETVWGWVEPLLAKGLKRYGDLYGTDDFRGYLLAEQCQLWALDNRSAVITDVTQYPRKKCGRVIAFVGCKSDVSSFLFSFEQWAKEQGCQEIHSEMRKGFIPHCKKAGWRSTHILMEKAIYA